MVRQTILFVFLVTMLPLSRSVGKVCIVQTESGENKNVCCADYEENVNDCIACFKGYTSHTGKKCIPCSNNTYGERCKHECSCSVFEMCHFVEGCVTISTKTGISVPKAVDERTIVWDVRETTNSVHDNVSGQIFAYYTLSLIVAVFGIWLCFVFYKRKTVPLRKRITINKSGNISVPQQQFV